VYELNVSQINGTGRNLLGSGFRQPQFTPDGNTLVVTGEGAPDLEHLVMMDASGGNKRVISNYTEDAFPTWRGDGVVVVYSSSSWGDGKTRLGMVYDIYGKGQSWIPHGGAEIMGEYPYYMADGKVVYNGCDFWATGGQCGLYWVWDNGGTPHRLTDHGSDTAPSGSQGRVAFMSSRAGNWEVYTVDLSDGSVKRLTKNNANDGLPTWSPDGKSIAFVSNRDGGWGLWVMSAGGSNQRKLFDIGGYGSGASDWTSERISWAP
jgi:Tol biopolymer transport system component